MNDNNNNNNDIQLGKLHHQIVVFFCDNCGMKVLSADSFIYGELPCDIDSANAGESAVVCHACHEKIEAGTLITNKKENQMTDPVAAARREYDNADEAFRLNPTDANLASYEIARKAFLLVAPVVAAVDEDQDERPFPDSDEAIRALQDVAEAVDELEAECYRLRAELKTALAKIEDLQEDVDYYTEISTDIGSNPPTEAETRMAEENKKRQEERMAKVEYWRGSTDPDVIAKVFPCGRPFTDEEKAEIVRVRAELKTSNAERDELRQQIENIKNGYEGGCYLCEVVGEMNKKLLAERDEARREVCRLIGGRIDGAALIGDENDCASGRGWDCFPD